MPVLSPAAGAGALDTGEDALWDAGAALLTGADSSFFSGAENGLLERAPG